MPELPEVETVTRQLSAVIADKIVQKVTVFKSKSWVGEVVKVEGQQIKEVSRRSKIIRLRFADNLNILIHLKMSGQLIFVDGQTRVGGGHPTADWTNHLPSKHTRVMFKFTDGTQLFFNDQRIFGWMKVMNDEEVAQEFALLAPDANSSEITLPYFAEKIAKRNVPIKQLIMDNQVIAGVGNIYACDALNLARISPLRPAASLSPVEQKKLLESIQTVIALGIQKGGATVHGKYVHVTGMSGHYQEVLRVYGRKGEPCPNCGAPIQKIKLAGRGTFFCPNCQV